MTEFPSTPDRAKESAEELAEAGRRASHKAQEYGERALERTGEAARTARDAALEHPIVTLAIVAGLAFAIGALWKTGGSRQQSGYDGLLGRFADLKDQVPRSWR